MQTWKGIEYDSCKLCRGQGTNFFVEPIFVESTHSCNSYPEILFLNGLVAYLLNALRSSIFTVWVHSACTVVGYGAPSFVIIL